MSAGMPELGSKISLISKADIRYEGRLFTVDPKECTIALANGEFFCNIVSFQDGVQIVSIIVPFFSLALFITDYTFLFLFQRSYLLFYQNQVHGH